MSDRKTWFGNQRVDAARKTELVKGVFSSVAGRYDLMNDLMSLGIHRLWKSALLDWLQPKPGLTYLDVAGGTGDIAFGIQARAPGASILVCDLTLDMIEEGRNRALDRGMTGDAIGWVNGNAEDLPVASHSFDAYTIAFGLRNVADMQKALKEAYRALRPGGRFLCLEFSHVAFEPLRKLYDVYSFQVLPQLGHFVAKDKDSYLYLAESIRRFPPQRELCSHMRDAGFAEVKYRNLSGGIAALHSGWRV